jgi:hypothetical protein
VWSEEEDKQLFHLFKEYGSKWSKISHLFPGRGENQVKNRFYSTLRRVANKQALQTSQGLSKLSYSKAELLRYVDDAIAYGHNCCSKRGRKKRAPPPIPPAEEPIAFNPFQSQRTPQMTGVTPLEEARQARQSPPLQPVLNLAYLQLPPLPMCWVRYYQQPQLPTLAPISSSSLPTYPTPSPPLHPPYRHLPWPGLPREPFNWQPQPTHQGLEFLSPPYRPSGYPPAINRPGP